LGLALQRVDVRQRQVRAEEPGLETDCLLKVERALGEFLLLDADRAEDRVGDRSRFAIREREAGLSIGFSQTALLYEQGRLLEC
jgi:hypothetical protein